MRIAVVNAGTATLKAGIAHVAAGEVEMLARAEAARGDGEVAPEIAALLAQLGPPLASADACAHRFVHGGVRRVAPALLDEALERELAALSRLAPLHNPVALACARAVRALAPERPQVAVFDTAFHADRAEESFRYALPWELCDSLEIRRFGFHGLAHASLLQALARAQGVPAREVDAVTLQLGAGCSACAIRAGRSLETSMGWTPLEGLPMATRCGDLDPAVVLALVRTGRSADEVERILARESGLLGLAGSADLRDVLRSAASGDSRAGVALALFARRITATVGAYFTLLDGRGALVFGGGIGARSPEIRARGAAGLGAWGIALDPELNAAGKPGRISRPGSRGVFVFPTDEETELARAAGELLEGRG
ncbi:MAG: acetate/propionate family kinase [Myxococcota bacterium]